MIPPTMTLPEAILTIAFPKSILVCFFAAIIPLHVSLLDKLTQTKNAMTLPEQLREISSD
jgi:hypothetical protein